MAKGVSFLRPSGKAFLKIREDFAVQTISCREKFFAPLIRRKRRAVEIADPVLGAIRPSATHQHELPRATFDRQMKDVWYFPPVRLRSQRPEFTQLLPAFQILRRKESNDFPIRFRDGHHP